MEQPVVGNERPRIAVLVASGDRPVLRMVTRFLATFPDVMVAGLADTIEEALERAAALNADVLLLDSNLIRPDDDVARAEYRQGLETEVIALVDSPDRLDAASDFPFVVTKSHLAAELVACIRRAAAVRGRGDNAGNVRPSGARTV